MSHYNAHAGVRQIVKRCMSTHLITIGWNETMESAYKRMHLKKVRHLPVSNDLGEIIGMLSDRDVQRAMISEIKRPHGQLIADESIAFDEEKRVRDYMSWPAKTIDQLADLRLAAERMIQEKVSSFLVVRQLKSSAKAVGILTAEDMLKVLIELLTEPKTPVPGWSLEDLFKSSGYSKDSVFS